MSCSWNRNRRIGNGYMCCGGAIFLGPDYVFMLATALVIILCSILFLIFTNVLAAKIVCGFAAITTLGLMWHCSTMDPGICPKASPPPENAPPHEPLMESVTYVDRNGQLQDAVLERRWCYVCNHYRPLRAVHCRFCDVCIARRDHHCPWVGTCVGERNYRFYWAFLWSTLWLTLTVMIGGMVGIIRRLGSITSNSSDGGKNAFFSVLAETHFIEPLLVLIAFIAFLLVAPLAAYHTMLVARNMTTMEEMRGGPNHVHYYNRGGCWENSKATLFSSIPPSMFLNERGFFAPSVEVVVQNEERENG
ncbi:DHHC containing zinc finger protein [Trypanosoma theileri]|uniref:Palmitoyltransferase n=1 Tax=Trypanosoma theileri TaxID=67003 RepID=A0A1X0NY30_9TRYP|nr:DHHC containing zinc finger protein [Trypanosoma theileri]ORC89577.1 DHHC containing zinc finger protein [Trypanosoma theileri]